MEANQISKLVEQLMSTARKIRDIKYPQFCSDLEADHEYLNDEFVVFEMSIDRSTSTSKSISFEEIVEYIQEQRQYLELPDVLDYYDDEDSGGCCGGRPTCRSRWNCGYDY